MNTQSCGRLSIFIFLFFSQDEQSWVRRDVHRARASVAARFTARDSSSSGVVVELPGGNYSAALSGLASELESDITTTTNLSED